MSVNLKKSISIAIAALNEERLIQETVESIFEVVKVYFSDYELILVNDGSTDRTGVIMNSLANAHDRIKVLHNETNLGLGLSFQKALKEARFEYYMLLCGDGGLPASSLPAIFSVVGTADIIIPWMSNLAAIKTPLRYLLSKTYTSLLNCLFRQKIRYYNGLPVYPVALLRQIEIKSSGFGFQGEIIIKLLKLGCNYREVQVLGSEKANRSRAVNLRNFVNIVKVFLSLILDLRFFAPSQPDIKR